MREIITEIEIEAAPENIWQILMDFAAYPKWNPFIKSIEGKPDVETGLKVFIQPPGSGGMNFSPTVTAFEPAKKFQWKGRLLLPGVFDGTHSFVIEPVSENKVRFIHSEQFSGLLVPFLWRKLDTETRRGFNEMNAALKKEAERKTNG